MVAKTGKITTERTETLHLLLEGCARPLQQWNAEATLENASSKLLLQALTLEK